MENKILLPRLDKEITMRGLIFTCIIMFFVFFFSLVIFVKKDTSTLTNEQIRDSVSLYQHKIDSFKILKPLR
jgi:hypothetical protein